MREAVVTLARDHFGADRRVRACWLSGPLAHHILTPYQEVVMGIAVGPEDYEGFVEELDQHITAILPPVSIWHHNWGADPTEVHYVQTVLEGGQYFELAVHRTDRLGPQPAPIVLLFKRDAELQIVPPNAQPARMSHAIKRFWFGALLAVSQISRGDRWEALDFLQTRRNLLIECWKLGQEARCPERLSVFDEQAPDAEFEHRLSETVPSSVEEDALAAALEAVTRHFDEVIPSLASRLGVNYPADLAAIVRDVLVGELKPYLTSSVDSES